MGADYLHACYLAG